MLPHFTKIRMQVVNVLFKICVAEWANIMKIVKESHSVNAKLLSVLVRVMGLVYLKKLNCLDYKSFYGAYFRLKTDFHVNVCLTFHSNSIKLLHRSRFWP